LRNLTDSYESWAYRNGLLKQANKLERNKMIEGVPGGPDDRLVRLTEHGRLHVLGGRDPAKQWSRAWDGLWRLILFDVPVAHNYQRVLLRRHLRDSGFGYLQKSVWITPDRLEEERQLLLGSRIDVECLVMMEGHACAGESDAEIVSGAWDFVHINKAYTRHLAILEQRPPRNTLRNEKAARALLRWGAAEREAWLHAVHCDPLLPEKLLPPGYLGQRSWRRRIQVLGAAGRQLRDYHV
jgi:phenylacetic acid degradation operon negative regulatory protein